MSSDDEEEGLGAIVVEPLEEGLSDEDFLVMLETSTSRSIHLELYQIPPQETF